MGKFANAIFAATSLAPILLAYVINDFRHGRTWIEMSPFLGAFVGLTVLFFLLVYFARHQLGSMPLTVTTVSNTDKSSLEFLIAYLLPILADKATDFRANWPVALYVVVILFVTVYHSNAFHFNPLLSIFGWHFYEVTTADEMKHYIVTKASNLRPGTTRNVVRLSNSVFMDLQKD